MASAWRRRSEKKQVRLRWTEVNAERQSKSESEVLWSEEICRYCQCPFVEAVLGMLGALGVRGACCYVLT